MHRRSGVSRTRGGHDAAQMDCRCKELAEAYGNEAEEYAREHLHSDEVRTDAFEEGLACPDTAVRFTLDYPERTKTDPGQARLRRL
jgi:hypothetical protein